MLLPEFKRILLIRWGKIGDVLFTTPVFRAIRNKYPHSYLAVITDPLICSEIISGNPDIDEIFVFDLKRNKNFKKLKEQIEFIKNLRAKKFDLVIDLYHGGRAPFLAYLCGAKYRLGADDSWKKMFFNILYTPSIAIKHCIELELDKIYPLQIKDKLTKDMIMCVSDEDRRFINKMFDIKPNDLVIGINPGAECPSKRWKVEGFAEVGDALVERYNAKVIIVQNLGQEKTLAHQIKNLMKNPANIASELTLKQLAALTEACNIFISGDTGPLHIAVAMGTSTVSLFTSTIPELASPISGEHRVIYKGICCDNCLKENCKDLRCVEAISSDDVLREVDSLLQHQDNAPDRMVLR
ncbi:MAG: glycosyltransferase family 9 protein [Candidatus Desantisbacteria bacterium]